MSSNNDRTTEPDPLIEILALVRKMARRLTTVESALSDLDAKVDERRRDTKPIWEQAIKEIIEIKEELRAGFRKVERKFDVSSGQALDLQAGMKELEARLDKFAEKPQ